MKEETSWAVVGSKGVDVKEVVGAVSRELGSEEEEGVEGLADEDDGFLPVRVPQRDMMAKSDPKRGQ